MRDDIERWFDLNLDVKNRTIYMGSMMQDWEGGESGVDNFMAEYFVKAMHVLESKGSKEITIVMNNPGGDWFHGMAIFDSIKYAKSPCTIKVYGHAMSMGSIILQAGDKRILMPNSRFMIHYGYDGKYGHSKIFERWADEGKRINHDMENIYLDVMMEKEEKEGDGYLALTLNKLIKRLKEYEHPVNRNIKEKIKFSKDPQVKREEIRAVLQSLLNFDTILTADETVELGFADEVYSAE